VFDFLNNPDYNLVEAFWTTIQLTFFSAIGALVWGTILVAMRVSPVPIMRGFATAYVNIFRNTPLTVIIIFTSLGLSSTLGINLAAADSPTSLADNAFRLAVLGFIVYTATFVCESLRSGINTVDPGQAEAARSIGMTFGKSLRVVILPQAFRAVIPPLVSVYIALAKNTSVAAAFGVTEATYQLSNLNRDFPDQLYLSFLGIALGYIVIVAVISLTGNRLERRVAVGR